MRKALLSLLSLVIIIGIFVGGFFYVKKYHPNLYNKGKVIYDDAKSYIDSVMQNSSNSSNSNSCTIFVVGELSSDSSNNTAEIIIKGVNCVLEEGQIFYFDGIEYTLGHYDLAEEGFYLVVPMDKGIYNYIGQNVVVTLK